MELVPAFRRFLLHLDEVRSYVADDWVFADNLKEHVDQTGRRAIVVRDDGGYWAPADTVQTSEYPILALDFWSDCSRDDDGNKKLEDALVNARAMYRAVAPLLHGWRDVTVGAFGTSPGLRVVSSATWGGPVYQTKAESHGGRFLGVQLGESAVVTARFALHVVH
jgi:hypothetical protein